MPDKTSFNTLVDGVRNDLSTDSFGASASLDQNSFTNPIQEAAARVQAEQEGYAQDAWSDDPASLTNYFARLVSGASRTAGEIVQATVTPAATDVLGIPQQYLDAYNLVQSATEDTPEVQAARELLQEKTLEITDDELAIPKETTYEQRIGRTVAAQEFSQDVANFFDISSIVNQGQTAELNQALTEVVNEDMPQFEAGKRKFKEGDTWEGLKDIADASASILFKGVGEAASNPMAVAEYVAENIPSMLGRPVATLSNIGYAEDIFTESVEEFKKQNQGQLPSQDELGRLAALSASAALAEQVGDISILGKGTTKAGTKTLAKSIVKGGKDLVETGITEGATEAYQTAVEDYLTKNKDIDVGELFKSAIIGSATGVGLTGSIKTATAPASIKERAKEAIQVSKVKDAKVQEAATTGTIDVDKAVSDPDAFIAELEASIQSEQVSPEKKEENLTVASEQVNGDKLKAEELATEIVDKELAGEDTSSLKAELKEVQERIKTTSKGVTNATAKIALITEQDIETATTDTETAKRVFGSFKFNADAISEEQAIKLAEANNGLTEEQNQQLRTHAEVQKTLRTIGQTRSHVVDGGIDPDTGRQMLGIKDYRDMVLQGQGAQALPMLKAFADRHTAKAQEYTAALAEAQATGKSIKVGKNTIHANSTKLVNAIRREAEALNKAYDLYSKGEVIKPTEPKVTPTVTEEVKPTEPVTTEVVEEVKADVTPTEEIVVKPKEQPEVPTVEPIKDYSLAKEITKNPTANELFNIGSKTNALESNNDFVNQFKNDPSILSKFYPNGIIPEGATDVMNNFVEFHDRIVTAVDSIFDPDKKEELKYLDLVQYFVDDNGQLPNNVKTAVAVGAYNWLVANGKGAEVNTADDIRNMFGMGESEHVSNNLFDLIGSAGTTASSVKDSAGKAAVSTLNLNVKPTATINTQANLGNSFGNLIFGSLLESGMVEYTEVNNAEINAYLPEDTNHPSKGSTPFIKPTQDMLGYIDINRALSSFMNDVFGTPIQRPMPSFSIPKVPNQVSNSDQKVPAKTKAVLKEHNSRKHFMDTEVVQLFDFLGRDAQREILGYVTDTELKDRLTITHSGIAGSNRDIDRQLDIYDEFHSMVQESGYDQPFYFQHQPWSNNRIGMANAFNMQSSKVHRFMAYQESWKSEVNFNDPVAMRDFILSVGEGFDIVSDKQSQDKSYEKTMAKLQEPLVRKAIDALKAVLRNPEADTVLVRDIVEGVKGNEKMHTFAVLTAMAKMEIAKESNTETFTHNLMRECDGITNAAGFTSLQFPLEDSEQQFSDMARVGMYAQEINYADWKAQPGSRDSYENIAYNWEQNLRKKFNNANPEQIKAYMAAQYIIGSFSDPSDPELITKDGRNAAKNPLMTTIYGSSIGGVMGGFSDKFIDTFYSKLQKAIDAGDVRAITMLMRAINRLTGSNYKTADLNFSLKKNEIKRLKESINGIYQDSLETALKQSLPEVFEARDKLNKASQYAFNMFNQMYQYEVEQVLSTKEGKIKEITKEEHKAIMDKLQNAMPIVKSFMSTELNEGILLAKTELVPAKQEGVSDNLQPYYAQTKFKKKIKAGKKAIGSTSNYGMRREFKDPGVMALPMMVQSMDSAVMQQTIKNNEVLNVFDAIGVGTSGFEAATKEINRNFGSVSWQYNILKEATDMLQRVYTEYGKYDLPMLTDSKGKAITNVDIATAITETRNAANIYQQRKQDYLRQTKVVGQYFDGANTVFTQPRTFGSAAKSVENFSFNDPIKVNSMTTEEVFKSLQDTSVVSDSTEHNAHLQNTLRNIINQVVTPFNLHLGSSTETETIGVTDGADMYIVNQVYGTTPQSGSTVNGIRMSSGEVFVHELVHNITANTIQNDTAARRELQKLWTQARKVLDYTAFLNDPKDTNPINIQAAKERYAHVFEPRTDVVMNGKKYSNYLHEFVALGMTNENFRNALQQQEAAKLYRREHKGLLNKIINWFDIAIDKVNQMILGTKGNNLSAQLEQLALNLANVDSSNKAQLRRKVKPLVEPIVMIGKPVIQIKDIVTESLGRPLKQFKNNFSVVGDKVVKTDAYRTWQSKVNESVSKLENSNNTYAEMIVSVVNEARGRTDFNGALHDIKRLANQVIDRDRENLRVNIRRAMNAAFHTELNQEEKSVLTYGLYKTDFTSLIDAYGEEDALDILRNKEVRNAKIKDLQSKLRDNFYITQANALGHFIVTGESKVSNLLLNATNIAKKMGTTNQVTANPVTVKLIDTLATLHAVDTLSQSKVDTLLNIIDREYSIDPRNNGITFTLDMLSKYRKDSAKEFADNPEHIIKGYITDKVNPDISIKTGSLIQEAEYAAMGYTRSYSIAKDPADPSKGDMWVYVNNHGGQVPYLAGLIYLNTKTARGTDTYDLRLNAGDITGGQEDIDTIKGNKSRLGTRLNSHVNMVPIVNAKGEISGYRYLMAEQNKDDILQRDTSFDDLMGIMSSNLKIKPKITETNKQTVKALYEQFKADSTVNASRYIEVSPRSGDQRLREAYAMMPDEMRKEIKRIWGMDRMLVRDDVLDLVLGYRKVSAAGLWDMNKEERNLLQDLFVSTVAKLFGGKAALRVRQGENLIQALVKLGKDYIVIRSGIVTLGNTVSNAVYLWNRGVSMKDIVINYGVAYKSAQRYQKQSKQLADYQNQLEFSRLTPTQRRKLESNIAALEDDISNNPIGELIDEGVLQNIVDDVDVGVQDFSVKKSLLDRYQEPIDKTFSQLPKVVRDIASNALVLQGSELYESLSNAAQFSDFGARYVLYKHLTEGKNKIDKKVAIGQIVDEFIDYDIPTHRNIEYLNNMGLVMFTKYLIRVQKMILNLIVKNPAKTLQMLMVQNLMIGDVSDITDSLIGIATNPLSRLTTPLDFLDAPLQTAPIYFTGELVN